MSGISHIKLALIKKIAATKVKILEELKPKLFVDPSFTKERQMEKISSFVLGVFVKCFRDEIALH